MSLSREFSTFEAKDRVSHWRENAERQQRNTDPLYMGWLEPRLNRWVPLHQIGCNHFGRVICVYRQDS